MKINKSSQDKINIAKKISNNFQNIISKKEALDNNLISGENGTGDRLGSPKMFNFLSIYPEKIKEHIEYDIDNIIIPEEKINEFRKMY